MTEIDFYYSPGACSLAVHIALEETGLPFAPHAVPIADGAHRTPAYRAINPRGRVPALVVDGTVLTELPALLQLVDELGGGTLSPADPVGRATMRGRLAFYSSTVHIGFAQVWRPERFSDDPALAEPLAAGGRAHIAGWFGEIEAWCAPGPWIMGAAFGLADLMPLVFYRWGRRIGMDMAAYPAWTAHSRRLLGRPAVQRAIAREGLAPAEFCAAEALAA